MGESTTLFFSTSPKAKILYPLVCARIYRFLHQSSLQLTETYLETLDPYSVSNWNSSQKDEFYKTSLQTISDSHICLFEVTHPSLTQAHFVKFSLDQDKPTVLLYKEKTKPFLLEETGLADPIFCEYDEHNLEQVLRFGIRDAQDLPEAIRFNCLISAKLNRYITQAAKVEHLSKSEFFRKLVEDHRRQRVSEKGG